VSLGTSPNSRSPKDGVATSIFRGPVLLAYDGRLNPERAEDSPVIETAKLNEMKLAKVSTWLKPLMSFETTAIDGKPITLCDFASAGMAGNPYETWLPLDLPFQPPKEFTQANPMRTFRTSE